MIWTFLRAILISTPIAVLGCQDASYPPDPPLGRWDEVLETPNTVYMPTMTAGEIAAAQRAGARDVIVPIGGLEQNGPHVITGKHDLVVRRLADSIAMARGNTLVASVVSFVPQGRLSPPSGHLRTPGTIGLTEETYQALLTDITQSLLATGFDRVFLIGDSGGNQAGMQAVAAQDPAVFAIASFYAEDFLDRAFLAARGKAEVDGDIHTTYRHEAILATIDPSAIRFSARQAAGAVEINTIIVGDLANLQADGEAIIAYRTSIALKAIDKASSTVE